MRSAALLLALVPLIAGCAGPCSDCNVAKALQASAYFDRSWNPGTASKVASLLGYEVEVADGDGMFAASPDAYLQARRETPADVGFWSLTATFIFRPQVTMGSEEDARAAAEARRSDYEPRMREILELFEYHGHYRPSEKPAWSPVVT